ncbi:MAG: cupin domain-containing protein [Candidatus Eisenbacteria bacterium]|nr:cupin domain-containing protein [Candidatus Latescibacterota bacterium]MBD3302542.1 cupin domain-containing protein [Candidatus Eisenbacteria bacterium]
MRITKSEIPVKIDAPGAVARQKTDFGDAGDYGKIGGEHFALDAGTDLTPLLQGLEEDLCQSPHWGYLIEGGLTVTYRDGEKEQVSTGDLFYWPPGHTVKAEKKTEFVLFSPQQEHTRVMDHILGKMGS